MSAEIVYERYRDLWLIERAYRITKGTLEVRPMFHFPEKRIEAHVCFCFVAYKVYKELERILRECNINLSVDKVISIAKTIPTVKIRLPKQNKVIYRTMILTPKHKAIAKLLDEQFYKNLPDF
ncbi:MAG: hypothetical protein LBE13_05030 [Bacteroidales bacterium]|nr:hypothetical protein [Bacteroidales bacterium]